MIPAVVESSWTVPKKLEKILDELEVRGKIEIIQTTAMSKSDGELKRLVITQTLVKPPVITCGKNIQIIIMKIINLTNT